MRRRSFLQAVCGAAMAVIAPILVPGRPWEWDGGFSMPAEQCRAMLKELEEHGQVRWRPSDTSEWTPEKALRLRRAITGAITGA